MWGQACLWSSNGGQGHDWELTPPVGELGTQEEEPQLGAASVKDFVESQHVAGSWKGSSARREDGASWAGVTYSG